MKTHVATICLLSVAIGLIPAGAGRAAELDLVALPENANTIGVLNGDETYLEIGLVGWGPGWQYLGFRGEVDEQADGSRLTSTASVRASDATVAFDVAVRQAGPQRLQLDVNLTSDKATDLTYIIASLEIPRQPFEGGTAEITQADGQTRTVELPLGLGNLGQRVQQIRLLDSAGRPTTVSLEPACDVATDNAARIILAERKLAAGEKRHVTINIELPSKFTYFAGRDRVPDDPGLDHWYAFQPTRDYASPSEIGMDDWLEAPAGRHGRITRQDDRLIYDGRPIKLWGLNVCYSSCAPDRELAEQRARFYARYGVNSVRLHKYADGTGWAGIQSPDSFVEFDAEALDRMDYFVAQLKQRGIYVLLSSTFGVKLGPADRQYVPYMDEFGRDRSRVATGHGSVFLSRELQDLQIRQIVRLLEHRNPYTGLTYARDPAVAVVELFNEDSALFYGTLSQLQKVPTLRRRAAEQFTAYLEARYGSRDALVEAWGEQALNSFGNEGLVGESWEDRSIVPAGNPWFFDPEQLAGSQQVKRVRLLDTMRFLYEIQNDFYGRYVDAIRAAGYEGEILGSNWQAGRAMSHYYNLHSDALVGLIDRHNYFGGGSGSKIDNASMLAVPGSGLLSSGMQQVADRPFMLSEWIHVYPNEWGVEGPAILGAYGMGLQGWDASYMFQNRDSGGFLEQLGRDRWEVTAPQVLGIFPAVARQVLRGDVSESEVQATRYVHVPSLQRGQLGFEDRVTQQYDVKTFDSDKVPAQALAVARCAVRFTEEPQPTPVFDVDAYRQDHRYKSSTGQLAWQGGDSKLDGFFTIDSPATKAVVGFAAGRQCQLGEVSIQSSTDFAAIYVTAQEPQATIASSNRLLVVAIARARNSGTRILRGSRLLDRGGPPILMEPVQARIGIRKGGQPKVHILDHDGRRTGNTIPITEGTFQIDGARDQTCYWLIEY